MKEVKMSCNTKFKGVCNPIKLQVHFAGISTIYFGNSGPAKNKIRNIIKMSSPVQGGDNFSIRKENLESPDI